MNANLSTLLLVGLGALVVYQFGIGSAVAAMPAPVTGGGTPAVAPTERKYAFLLVVGDVKKPRSVTLAEAFKVNTHSNLVHYEPADARATSAYNRYVQHHTQG